MNGPSVEKSVQLKSLFREDFFSSRPEDLEEYGKDWSGVIAPDPSLIAFPRTTEEVSMLLKQCAEWEIPVVPSGGRTGLSGGAIAAKKEVVISLSKMNQIYRFEDRSLTLQVQAGVITEKVHEYLAPYGLTWPVDFASKGSSTVGGNLSTNAGGVRVIRYGLTRNWVLGLTVVLMSGEVLHLNGALEKNNTGLDLKHLFIGTEGTFGIITEAILKCAPVPSEMKTEVVLAAVSDFSKVIELFRFLRRESNVLLSAFETFTDECLREVVTLGVQAPFTGRAADTQPIYALFEIENHFPGGLGGDGSDQFWEKLISELGEGMLDLRKSSTHSEKTYLWSLRERVAEAILLGSEVHQQDLSVPVEHLEAFVGDIQETYAKNYPDTEVFLFGHIGDGNLHIFIRKPARLSSAEFHAFCEVSDQVLFQMTQKLFGSVSAEHGVGLLKKPALAYSKTPSELALMRQLKHVFDPKGLLNPGKIVD
jgi:FAD/FMN-containing dehydrogenase